MPGGRITPSSEDIRLHAPERSPRRGHVPPLAPPADRTPPAPPRALGVPRPVAGTRRAAAQRRAHARHIRHDGSRQHNVIGEHDGEGILVFPKDLFGKAHRVTQPQGLFLLHRNRVNELVSALNLGHLLILATGFKGLY